MKRFLLLSVLSLVASAGMATLSYAGAFGLFYCPKYCNSYCQAACPHNAFSPGGCGGGGCGAGTCGGAFGGYCPYPNPAPHATHLPMGPMAQPFGPICHNCGIASFGTGGLRHKWWGSKKCKGGNCGGEFIGGGYPVGGYEVPLGGPAIMDGATYGPIETSPPPAAQPTLNQPATNPAGAKAIAQYWTANSNAAQNPGTMTQPVSYYGNYPGYNYPMMPAWGYGYGYYPNYPMPMYNPAMWGQQGYPQR